MSGRVGAKNFILTIEEMFRLIDCLVHEAVRFYC